MLIRIFRGQARDGMEDRYARYLRDVAAPHILSHPGARDVQILDPLRDRDDFVVETVWDDLGSLISFAGDEWARPRIAPAEAEMISRSAVSHHRLGSGFRCEVVASTRVSVDPGAGLAAIDDEIYPLPPLELRLLTELVRRAGTYVDSRVLLRVVWHGTKVIAPNDVRRAVYRLRRLIRDHDRANPVVRSRRGYGYVIDK